MTYRYITPAFQKNNALFDFGAICLMSILVFFAYSNTLQSPFLFDDVNNIVENPLIRIKDFSSETLFRAASKSPTNSRWLPNISFAINYYFTGMAVQSYHIVNIIIHILCGIALYFLSLTTLTLHQRQKENRPFRTIALFASLVWLLHPVQTNGVTYIVQRMTSMATLFFLVSMVAYVNGRLQQQRGKRLSLLVLSAISGLMALFSKENAIMLPVMILGYEIFFLRSQGDKRFSKNFIYSGLALLLLSTAVVIKFYFAGGNPFVSVMSGYEARDFTLLERVLTQPRVIFHYLSIIFWPTPGRFNLSYDFVISKSLLVPPITAISILGLFCMGAGVFLLFNKNRLISFAIFWFLGNLIIESSIIPLEIIFEHRMYLPSVFIIIAVISLFYEIPNKKIVSIALAVTVVLLAYSSWQRNADWQSEVRMWSDVVTKAPNLARAHVNLGKALVKEGRYAEAQDTLVHSINLDPESGNAYLNLAIVLEYQNNPEQALANSDKALEAGNANPAKIHQVKGLAYAKLGNLQSAILEMEKALEYNPDSSETYVNLGIVYGRTGNHVKAEQSFRKAFLLDPDNGFALQNLGIGLEKQNRIPEAIQIFEQALTKPIGNAAAIHNNLAVLYLRLKSPDRALFHALKSTEINGNFTQGFITAGRAYEMAGQDQLAFLQYGKAWRRGFNMVALYNQWAERALQNRETARAAIYLNEALKLSPSDAKTMQILKTIGQKGQP